MDGRYQVVALDGLFCSKDEPAYLIDADSLEEAALLYQCFAQRTEVCHDAVAVLELGVPCAVLLNNGDDIVDFHEYVCERGRSVIDQFRFLTSLGYTSSTYRS